MTVYHLKTQYGHYKLTNKVWDWMAVFSDQDKNKRQLLSDIERDSTLNPTF